MELQKVSDPSVERQWVSVDSQGALALIDKDCMVVRWFKYLVSILTCYLIDLYSHIRINKVSQAIFDHFKVDVESDREQAEFHYSRIVNNLLNKSPSPIQTYRSDLERIQTLMKQKLDETSTDTSQPEKEERPQLLRTPSYYFRKKVFAFEEPTDVQKYHHELKINHPTPGTKKRSDLARKIREMEGEPLQQYLTAMKAAPSPEGNRYLNCFITYKGQNTRLKPDGTATFANSQTINFEDWIVKQFGKDSIFVEFTFEVVDPKSSTQRRLNYDNN